jgi:hypothetical protein
MSFLGGPVSVPKAELSLLNCVILLIPKWDISFT